MLPSFGPERRSTYSPFLPLSPRTGKVLQVPILEHDAEAGTKVETPVTGGHCKLQWKCDWARRWAAFGVDYEMAGKDLVGRHLRP
jgi:lysyl-tRNA synthetase class 1